MWKREICASARNKSNETKELLGPNVTNKLTELAGELHEARDDEDENETTTDGDESDESDGFKVHYPYNDDYFPSDLDPEIRRNLRRRHMLPPF